jgi:hypothetical protein
MGKKNFFGRQYVAITYFLFLLSKVDRQINNKKFKDTLKIDQKKIRSLRIFSQKNNF